MKEMSSSKRFSYFLLFHLYPKRKLREILCNDGNTKNYLFTICVLRFRFSFSYAWTIYKYACSHLYTYDGCFMKRSQVRLAISCLAQFYWENVQIFENEISERIFFSSLFECFIDYDFHFCLIWDGFVVDNR